MISLNKFVFIKELKNQFQQVKIELSKKKNTESGVKQVVSLEEQELKKNSKKRGDDKKKKNCRKHLLVFSIKIISPP